MLLLFLFVDLSRNRYRLSPFGFTRRPLPPVCSIVPNGRRSECGKIGNIPPSSQCFDQKHTRVQSTALDIYGVSLVGELDRLRGDDLEVGVAAFIEFAGSRCSRDQAPSSQRVRPGLDLSAPMPLSAELSLTLR